MAAITLKPGNPSFDIIWTVNRYLSMEGELVSEDFSPPGSKDVWYIEVPMIAEFADVRVRLCLKERGDGSEDDLEVMVAAHFEFGGKTYGLCSESFEFAVGDSEQISSYEHEGVVWQRHENYTSDLKIVISLLYVPTTPDTSDERPGATSVAEDIVAFVSNGFNAFPPDFKLVGSDGVVMAHKLFLAIRSDVFRSLLSSDMMERNKNEIELKDFDKRTLQQFAKFLTADTVEDLPHCAADLFVLADKYQIVKLLSICEKYLAENVTTQNSARLLALTQQIPSQIIMKKMLALYKV